MRYTRSGNSERCDFDPQQGYVILTEAEFTQVFGFPSRQPQTVRMSLDVRKLWVSLAVKGQLPSHLEAAVKALVETDDDWADAYAEVRDLPRPGESWDGPLGDDEDNAGEEWKRGNPLE